MAKEGDGPPVYTVIGGPNGAGKSTLAQKLIKSGHDIGTFVNPDEIALRLDGADNVKALIAGRETLRLTRELIDKGENFTRETTLTSREILRSMEQAKVAGFQVNLVYVGVNNLDTSKARVEDRVAKGGHDIPSKDQERRFNRSLDNASIAAKRADQALFFHNGDKGHELVATVRNGEIVEIDAEKASWLDRATEGLDRTKASAAPFDKQTAAQRIAAAEKKLQTIRDPERREMAEQHLETMKKIAGVAAPSNQKTIDKGEDFENDIDQ